MDLKTEFSDELTEVAFPFYTSIGASSLLATLALIRSAAGLKIF
jgi:hypothetical protein